MFQNSYFSRLWMIASAFTRYYCDVSPFLVQLLLKSTFTSQIFTQFSWYFLMKIYLMILKSKYFDLKMSSHELGLTKLREHFLEDVSIRLDLSHVTRFFFCKNKDYRNHRVQIYQRHQEVFCKIGVPNF